MIETEVIETKKGAALGIRVNLPTEPLLIVQAEKGYLVCGYFDSEAVEKANDCAVIIRGGRNFEEMLKNKVSYVSPSARKLKINENMTGRQALDKMI